MFWKIATCLFILLSNPFVSAQVEEELECEVTEEPSQVYLMLHHYENMFVGTAVVGLAFASAMLGLNKCWHMMSCDGDLDGIDIDGRPKTPLVEDH